MCAVVAWVFGSIIVNMKDNGDQLYRVVSRDIAKKRRSIVGCGTSLLQICHGMYLRISIE